jgi:hypothetical protein
MKQYDMSNAETITASKISPRGMKANELPPKGANIRDHTTKATATVSWWGFRGVAP